MALDRHRSRLNAYDNRIVRERKVVWNGAKSATLAQFQHLAPRRMVPLAGLEPACLAAFDFESNASTNFATGAAKPRC